MNKFFYPKLAISNIRNNKSIYLPYLLAGSIIVALFYTLRSVAFLVSESQMSGGTSMNMILTMSSWICGLFCVLIVFYINSFIMKRRKKEFGLYSILGMEKHHIIRVMLWEVLTSAACSIILGIIFGIVFGQLTYLFLLKIIGIPTVLEFKIVTSEMLKTIIIFAVCYVMVLIYDIISIAKAQPIELLKTTQSGEKEPKSNWVIALVGALTLGGGYALALYVKTPSGALGVFLPAVILVIIGTYFTFIAGSVVVLKLLRKHKKFYYNPKNFVSVSGMIYRMKQNAAGLASICILSTCVLVTLASTVCLYIGEEDILQQKFPRQIVNVSYCKDENSMNLLTTDAQSYAKSHGVKIENEMKYTSISLPAEKNGNSFDFAKIYSMDIYELEIILVDDYADMVNSSYTLQKDEILAYDSANILQKGQSVTIGGKTFKIAELIEKPSQYNFIAVNNTAMFVVPNLEIMQQIEQQYKQFDLQEAQPIIKCSYWYDVSAAEERLPLYYSEMKESLISTQSEMQRIDNKDAARTDFFEVYGSIMFVGVFFVSLFTIAAVLIIYYKQITEGYDDHDRFIIMQKVGMSNKKVRATINKQVLMVFYLPLLVSILHLAVAFPVLCKVLTLFGMLNVSLFIICAIATVLIFTVIYFIVYNLTAKTYYKIVEAK